MATTDMLTHFADRLKAARTKAGLTGAELAAKAGCSRKHIHSLETGRSRPSWEIVPVLAAALGIDQQDFFAAAKKTK